MKIYLAARFEQKMDMREVRERLQVFGHEITSQWLDVEHEEDNAVKVTDDDRMQFAIMDVNDVCRADVLVAFSSPRSEPHIGGGRHFEFGYAAAEGLEIVVVGPKGEHIFHYLPDIKFATDIEDLVKVLKQIEFDGAEMQGSA